MEIFTSTETIMIKPGDFTKYCCRNTIWELGMIQGFVYPQRMRRLYGIYNVCFLILMITCS